MKNRALRAPISTRPSWADCGVFSLTGLKSSSEGLSLYIVGFLVRGQPMEVRGAEPLQRVSLTHRLECRTTFWWDDVVDKNRLIVSSCLNRPCPKVEHVPASQRFGGWFSEQPRAFGAAKVRQLAFKLGVCYVWLLVPPAARVKIRNILPCSNGR